MTPTPLLLFAPPGGDIAWAAASIGHCAGMLALPELRLGSAATVDEVLALHARAEDRAGDGLLRTVAQLRFGAQQPDTIDAAAHWLQRRAEWTIAQLLDWLLSHANGRHLVFHEPHDALRIDAIESLLRALPDALVVQLVEAVPQFSAHVHHELQGRLFIPPEAQHHADRYPVLAPSLMWFRVHDTLLRVQQSNPDVRWRRLRSDFLRDRPHRVLPPLLAEIAARATPGDSGVLPFAMPGPPNAPLGDDVRFLRTPGHWPEPESVPADPGLDHPDLLALAERLGVPLPQGALS